MGGRQEVLSSPGRRLRTLKAVFLCLVPRLRTAWRLWSTGSRVVRRAWSLAPTRVSDDMLVRCSVKFATMSAKDMARAAWWCLDWWLGHLGRG